MPKQIVLPDAVILNVRAVARLFGSSPGAILEDAWSEYARRKGQEVEHVLGQAREGRQALP